MLNKLLLSFILPILVLIFRPLSLDTQQSIILAALIFTIITWATGTIKSSFISIFLLIIFSVFGNTPLSKVFSFLLSESFVIVLFSFIFSQGIANSNLTEKVFQPLISKYAKNVYQLIGTVLLSALVLVFVIPQPISRVIMLSFIFNEYFTKIGLKGDLKEILMLSTIAFPIFTSSIFKRSDILLNPGTLSIANISMTEGEWTKYMTVPGIMMALLAVALYFIVFRKDLKKFDAKLLIKEDSKIELTKFDKVNLSLIGLVVLLWSTESIHHISGAIVVVLGTLIMYFRKIVGKKDIKSVNITILLFLTAILSIGAVMKGSGVAEVLFGSFINVLPKELSSLYVVMIIVISMSLHMVLGSNLTTMSVVIPGLLTITSGALDPIILMFIVYLSLTPHFILPFHNTIFVVGLGKNYYSSRIVTKLGIFTTLLVFISIFGLFIPWWKFIGVL